jgi:hypothetical protein
VEIWVCVGENKKCPRFPILLKLISIILFGTFYLCLILWGLPYYLILNSSYRSTPTGVCLPPSAAPSIPNCPSHLWLTFSLALLTGSPYGLCFLRQ